MALVSLALFCAGQSSPCEEERDFCLKSHVAGGHSVRRGSHPAASEAPQELRRV